MECHWEIEHKYLFTSSQHFIVDQEVFCVKGLGNMGSFIHSANEFWIGVEDDSVICIIEGKIGHIVPPGL